jgi:hypothetical protein
MSLTTDPNDPRLPKGAIGVKESQHDVYLVLSDEERAKGFVRPVHRSYVHVGQQPTYPLRDLTEDEQVRHNNGAHQYAKYEVYPESRLPLAGRYWTQKQLDKKECGAVTTMGLALCETYARHPKFYGATYCCGCGGHYPVAEFKWPDGSVVGS